MIQNSSAPSGTVTPFSSRDCGSSRSAQALEAHAATLRERAQTSSKRRRRAIPTHSNSRSSNNKGTATRHRRARQISPSNENHDSAGWNPRIGRGSGLPRLQEVRPSRRTVRKRYRSPRLRAHRGNGAALSPSTLLRQETAENLVLGRIPDRQELPSEPYLVARGHGALRFRHADQTLPGWGEVRSRDHASLGHRIRNRHPGSS